MALSSAPALARPTSFLFRLRAAAAKPLILWPSTIAITFAAMWTWATTTLAMNPALQPMGDFVVYYNAASDLNHGIDPYLRFVPGRPFSLALSYVYPPLVARALQPVAHLSLQQAEFLAVLFFQACVVVSAVLLWRLLSLRTWPARLLVLDCLLLSKGVVANLADGQVNLILMPLTTAFLTTWIAGWRYALVFAALNTSLKLQQAPLLGLALIRRQWVALAWGLVTIAASLIFGGLSLAQEYFTSVLPRLSTTIPTSAQNTSLVADIERLLHPGSDDLPYDPSYPEAHVFYVFILALVLFFTVRGLWRLRDRRAEGLLALSAVPLAASYVACGHLIPFLPAYILLAVCAVRERLWRLLWVTVPALLLIAEYPLFFTLASASNFFVARALFYEFGPGLAALALWIVALILARRAAQGPIIAGAQAGVSSAGRA